MITRGNLSWPRAFSVTSSLNKIIFLQSDFIVPLALVTYKSAPPSKFPHSAHINIGKYVSFFWVRIGGLITRKQWFPRYALTVNCRKNCNRLQDGGSCTKPELGNRNQSGAVPSNPFNMPQTVLLVECLYNYVVTSSHTLKNLQRKPNPVKTGVSVCVTVKPSNFTLFYPPNLQTKLK